MSRLIRIPNRKQKAIVALCQAMDSPVPSRIPPEYFSPLPPIRMVFWQRLRILARLFKPYAPRAKNGLDFGDGVSSPPTLANFFPRVTLLDLATEEAQVTTKPFELSNVTLVAADE